MTEYLAVCLLVSPFALALAWFTGRGLTSPKPKKVTLYL